MGDNKLKFWQRKEVISSDYSSIMLSLDALCKGKSPDAEIPAYFMIFRNSKLFNQSGIGKDGDAGREKRETNGDQKRQRVDRCKKQYRPTNNIVLSSVVLDKTDSVMTQIHFKKGNVSYMSR